jgi:hypothetical protein
MSDVRSFKLTSCTSLRWSRGMHGTGNGDKFLKKLKIKNTITIKIKLLGHF